MSKRRKQAGQVRNGGAVNLGTCPPVAASSQPELYAVLICIAATLLCLAPFAAKAFHIDDTVFLYVARQICAHPLDPYGFNINWYGYEMCMAEVNQNGPLVSYYIALAASCVGWSEIALHLAFLFPALAAVLGTYFLAARFCTRPLLAALATLLCPVFLVSSTTLMCDVMMLAFWVWAVFLWVRGTERGSHLSLALAACMIAAAAVTKYSGVALIPLLLAYSLLNWPRIRWRLLYLAISVALLLAYDVAMHRLYGHSVLYGAGSYALSFGEGSYVSRGLVTLSFAGGCLAMVIFYAPMLWSWRTIAIATVAAGLVVAILYINPSLIAARSRDSIAASLILFAQVGVLLVAGCGLLALAVADIWRLRNADSCLLLLWMAGIFLFCWIFNWTVNGRSILPMAPVAGILVARRLDMRKRADTGRRVAWQYVPLAFLGLLSLTITCADASMANTARLAAAELNRRYADQKDTVFFAGHWGFQYYMESYGFRAIDIYKLGTTNVSVLVMPETNSNLYPIDPSATVTTLEWPAFPIAATQRIGAGFYCSLWGPAPFAFGSVPPDHYHVLIFDSTGDKVRDLLAKRRQFLCLNPDNVILLNDVAWTLAANPEASIRNGVEAEAIAQRATELTGGREPVILDTLAAAFAEAGHFSDALRAAQFASNLATQQGKTRLAEKINSKMALYKAGKPYHETPQHSAER